MIIISTLDQERGQRDQKLLIRIKPSNRPDQQLELCALYEQKAIDRDHSIRQYEHDRYQGKPMEIPLYQREIKTMSLYFLALLYIQ